MPNEDLRNPVNPTAVTITKNARIPVIPLDYGDRDLAQPKELLVDAKKGKIYIVSAEDKSIIFDITKQLAEDYLSQIDGNKTWVIIEGIGKVNLAEILKELNDSKVELLNPLDDSTALPAQAALDNSSIVIKDYVVQLYGFDEAPEEATLRKKDGRIEWVDPNSPSLEDPLEPKPGSNLNVIDIFPTNDKIILYAKPYMYTYISESPESIFLINLPKSRPKFARMRWKLDSLISITLKFPSNIMWIDENMMGTEVSKNISANTSYLIEMESWDFGETWIVTYVKSFPLPNS